MYPVIPVSSNYTPIVPATPAPKTVDAMRGDVGERFVGMVMIKRNPETPLNDYFIEYDNWEAYSEVKNYTSETYHAAYSGTMKLYQNYLFLLSGADGDEYYVAAKRIPSELETLEPYCQCFSCKCSVVNPLKYLWCAHCNGCIKAGVGCAKKEYIDKARLLKLEIKKPSNFSKYTSYVPGWPALVKPRVIEVACVILSIVALLIIF